MLFQHPQSPEFSHKYHNNEINKQIHVEALGAASLGVTDRVHTVKEQDFVAKEVRMPHAVPAWHGKSQHLSGCCRLSGEAHLPAPVPGVSKPIDHKFDSVCHLWPSDETLEKCHTLTSVFFSHCQLRQFKMESALLRLWHSVPRWPEVGTLSSHRYILPPTSLFPVSPVCVSGATDPSSQWSVNNTSNYY